MSEPYLVAHVVRGQPAFDIAEQMDCPVCHGKGALDDKCDCDECETSGYWWIVSTSGHRAYPYAHWPLYDICNEYIAGDDGPKPPPNWPDHYAVNKFPKEATTGRSLLAQLGLVKKVERRI